MNKNIPLIWLSNHCLIWTLILFVLLSPAFCNAQWSEKSLKKISQEKSIYYNLNHSYFNLVKNSDSARYYANQALKQALKQNSAPPICLAYAFLAHVDFQKGNYSKAYEELDLAISIESKLSIPELDAYIKYIIGVKYNFLNKLDLEIEQLTKALSIYEQINDSTGAASLYKALGILYSQSLDSKDVTKAIAFFQKSLKIHMLTHDDSRIGSDLSMIGKALESLKKYDSASIYLLRGVTIDSKYNNSKWVAGDYQLLGILKSNIKQYDSAEYYLNKAKEEFIKIGQIWNTISIINQKGQNAREQNRFKLAIQLHSEAYLLSIKYQIAEEKLYAIEGLYKTAASQGDNKNAYKYLLEYSSLNDSITKSKNLSVLSLIEIQYKYEFKKRAMQLENEKISLASSRKSLYLILLISLTLFIIIFFLVVFYFLKVRQRALQLDKKKLNLDIDYKNKELTINIMSLMKKNEAMAEISKKLSEMENEETNTDLKIKLKHIAKQVQDNAVKEIWEEFDLRFKEVHSTYYKTLLTKYPDLTTGELRLCAFLRLNLSSKEISQLTGQNIKALEMARFRLRKKLGIIDPDVNLVKFLSGL